MSDAPLVIYDMPFQAHRNATWFTHDFTDLLLILLGWSLGFRGSQLLWLEVVPVRAALEL